VPCARKSGPADLLRLLFEHVDEEPPDGLALHLGVGDALQLADEQVLGLHVNEGDVVVVAKQRHDLLGLVRPHQAVIDEHAGELLADGFVDQHRSDGGIDAAREAADHAAAAHLLADALHGLLLEGAHGPIARAARDIAHEVADEERAVGRVGHLRVELHRVELPALVAHHREGRVGRNRVGFEAVGELGDPVAVAHPDRVFFPHMPHALEERVLGQDLDLGAAEFRVVPALDLAAELHRHGLLAVADAEHRHLAVEHVLRRAGRALAGHGGRPAREDHALGLVGPEGFLGLMERHDLGIDPLLPDAPRDELRHLGAEIDDEDFVVGLGHGSSWKKRRRLTRGSSSSRDRQRRTNSASAVRRRASRRSAAARYRQS
jgi:hypothetical protein